MKPMNHSSLLKHLTRGFPASLQTQGKSVGAHMHGHTVHYSNVALESCIQTEEVVDQKACLRWGVIITACFCAAASVSGSFCVALSTIRDARKHTDKYWKQQLFKQRGLPYWTVLAFVAAFKKRCRVGYSLFCVMSLTCFFGAAAFSFSHIAPFWLASCTHKQYSFLFLIAFTETDAHSSGCQP